MRKIIVLLTLAQFSLAPVAFAKKTAARDIILKVEKKDGKVHFEPEQVEAHAGEKVRFVVKYEEAGADFHGFEIKDLGVASQVQRGKPLEVETTIPKDMKPGEHEIRCQFHPAHIPAKLVILPAEAKKSKGKS